MPADPILASNPLDTRTPDYRELAVMYGELWRKARDLQASIEASGNLHGQNMIELAKQRNAALEESERRGVLCDRAATKIERLQTALAYENEKVRSLSASVEELRQRAERAEWARTVEEEAGVMAVLVEREECAALCEQIGRELEDRYSVNNAHGDAYADAIRARSK